MITDDEVLRLFERADPAQTDDAAPAIDAAGYLDALRTRSSTMTYIDTEPTPTEPPTNHHRWLAAAAAAATVAVIAGGLVLAARDDDETGGASDPGPVDTGVESEPAPATQAPVTTPPPRPADELAAAEGPFETRVGFIGLPPEGATPSPSGEIVVSMFSCYAPIGELSEIDRLSPLAALWVLADGRLIWLKYEDLPEGANSLSTGLLEQRLTPEGVELMRSEATAALRTGEVPRCDAVDRGYGVAGGAAFDYIRADNEHLVRVMDPWSWLPATAWEDREIRAFVPSTYQVTIGAAAEVPIPRLEGEASRADRWDPAFLAQLPPAAVDVIEAKVWEFQGPGYATFTTDEARALAAALDDAGLERDGLWNAYRLDYQFEYHDEGRDMMAHIHFDPYVVVTGAGGCGPAFCIPVL